MTDRPERRGVTRRAVLEGTAACTVVAATVPARARMPVPAAPAAAPAPVALTVNGAAHTLSLDPRTTLLDMLRETLALGGTKKGCDHGQCGACTVIVNGRRIASCLSLAALHDGDHVATVEGLGTPDAMHPVQAAFVRHDAFQCGYCTPGQIMATVAMLDELRAGMPSHVSADLFAPEVSDAEIRERMSGNLCRCAAYDGILAAIRDAGGRA